ncbi:hypothetical protein BC830DRAFT_1089218 [Chytriomyces sp. MP71]|nr:hypothetical protein BC830DRAFT_1089218 [Chytriomyces sp. MP71]
MFANTNTRPTATDRQPLLGSGGPNVSSSGVNTSRTVTPRGPSPRRGSCGGGMDGTGTGSGAGNGNGGGSGLKTWFHSWVLLLTAGAVSVLALDAFWLAPQRNNLWPATTTSGATPIARDAFDAGVASCARNDDVMRDADAIFANGGAPSVRVHGNPRTRLLSRQRVKAQTASDPAAANPILLQHATVWDGVGGRIDNADVAIGHGVILRVGNALSVADVVEAGANHFDLVGGHQQGLKPFSPADVEVVDIQGKVVSPGLVDMHSHAGVDSSPGFEGDSDTNEMSGGPTNPYLRAQDGINPFDKYLDLIASGGVTTSLIIPGSGTLMGGEGLAIKMLKTSSNAVEDMTLNAGMSEDGEDGKRWRWMKMACGENPKRYFKSRNMMPGSRMGNGWLFRARFEEARNTLWAQEDWCATADALNSQFRDKAYQHMYTRYPDPLKDESLVALLRRQVRLQVHCYQTNDLEMMIRNKHEFDFPIVAFHHATEAYLLAGQLAAENISVAIFADHSLYKREAYIHSVRAGQVLHEAGVKVAYKSDHPVLNAQHLIYEAQKAAHYGLDEQIAFAAVTSVPAERIGAGWRIGRIAEGYDADVLVWDRPPLQMGAHPLRVIIDGYTIVSLPNALAPPVPTKPAPPIDPTLDFLATQLPAYTVLNCSGIYTQDTQVLRGKIVVEAGLVSCIGDKCANRGVVFNLNGGVLVPGLIAAGTPLGLEEIQQEEGTSDGDARSEDAVIGLVHAKDGLRVGGGGKLLEYAWKHGVLAGVSGPKGRGVVSGVSVAFRTAADRYSDAVLKPDVAVHVNIGNSAKEGYAGSVSAQLGKLRSLLTEGKADFTDVVSGKLPLVVTAHDPNDISKVLTLVAAAAPKARLVISGATGAWVVATELAAANVPVLLLPARCKPDSWEKRWCKAYGDGGPSAFELLKNAGVKVALSVSEPDQVRSLLFEAGWGTVGDSTGGGKVNVMDAVGAVTWRVADAFGLEDGLGRIVVGKRANFVGLDGGPVGFGYHIQILGDGAYVTTKPLQR